jgi:hypothetical protein
MTRALSRSTARPPHLTSEDELHAAIAGYLSWALEPPAWFTCFPAGGGGFIRGVRLKRLGLKAGVPDLLVFRPLPGGGLAALGIELKRPTGGKLLASQRETHPLMLAAGFQILAEARSLDEVKAALRTWDFPLREVKPSTERLLRGFRRGLAEIGQAQP